MTRRTLRTNESGLKVIVGASSGGHTNELLALLEYVDIWPYQPTAFVTTRQLLYPRYSALGRTYVISECNRESPISAVKVLWETLRIAFTERPDVLITTGAMPLAILATVVKLFGGKVIWIDSIAQVSSMSLSGKWVRRFADLCLVQRPHLAEDDERVEFVGALL
jgi:UDP-N-acetylglucosamine:LPS N-acetylglucosamine transferase